MLSESVRDHLSQVLFYLAQICAVVCVIYWWRHLPAPGYAIGALSVVAAAMSIHAEARTWQKAAWMLLIGSFLLVEFRAIRKDRADFASAEASKRAEENAKFRSEENSKFQKITEDLKASTKANQFQLAATMSRLDQNMNVLNGGKSYCYLTFNIDGLPRLALAGKNMLYELRVNVLDAATPFIVGNEWLVGSPVYIGELAPGSSRSMQDIEKPNNLNLVIFFAAKNGFWYEQFRGLYKEGTWVEAIRVFKGPFPKGVLLFREIDKEFPRGKNGEVTWE